MCVFCVFFVHCLYFFIGSWCNNGVLILVLFVYIPHSSLKPGIFHSIFFFFFFFCSVFIQKYIQNSRDNAFKHQINMISTKSICKCRKTWIYVALRFVRKHVQWQWKSLTLKTLMVAKKWQIKSVINSGSAFHVSTILLLKLLLLISLRSSSLRLCPLVGLSLENVNLVYLYLLRLFYL